MLVIYIYLSVILAIVAVMTFAAGIRIGADLGVRASIRAIDEYEEDRS